MSIQDWGAIGELIGSVAVLATLIYLALQLKSSNKASRQKSHSDILERRQELLSMQTRDAEFIEIWSKGCLRQPLTPIEAQRFTTYGVSFMSHVQDTYIQFQAGLVSEDVWEAEKTIAAPLFSQPGFIDWWDQAKQFHIPEFVQAIDTLPKINLVLYDSQTGTWSTPEGGKLAHEATETTQDDA